MLQIEGLRFRYRQSNFELCIPQLMIEQGAKVAVVGPSGTGKTTLLSLLAGVEVPEQGRIRLDHLSINQLSNAQRRDFRCARVGMVFQDFELVEYLNVRENIWLPYLINRRLRLTGEVQRRADELAEAAGISELLARPIRKLSHGERQRVAICRALLSRPSWILADEPTGSLDPANKQRLLKLLLDQAGASDATLLMVTHDHSLLDQFDRIIDFAEFHASKPTKPQDSESDKR